jgi:hypothetical protein
VRGVKYDGVDATDTACAAGAAGVASGGDRINVDEQVSAVLSYGANGASDAGYANDAAADAK